MSWLILFFAGLAEVAWAAGLKLHDGRPSVIIGTILSAGVSIALLGLAMKEIPLGTAYAAWTGMGILGTVALGLFLGEPMPTQKLLWVALIAAGIIGLKVSAH